MPIKHFNIIPSNILRYWTWIVHVFAFFTLLILPVPMLVKTIFSILIGVSFLYAVYKNKQKKFVIQSFMQDTKDNWRLYTACGEEYLARLLRKNYVSDFLVILRFAGATRPVILFRHQLTQQDWCSLQMILRN